MKVPAIFLVLLAFSSPLYATNHALIRAINTSAGASVGVRPRVDGASYASTDKLIADLAGPNADEAEGHLLLRLGHLPQHAATLQLLQAARPKLPEGSSKQAIDRLISQTDVSPKGILESYRRKAMETPASKGIFAAIQRLGNIYEANVDDLETVHKGVNITVTTLDEAGFAVPKATIQPIANEARRILERAGVTVSSMSPDLRGSANGVHLIQVNGAITIDKADYYVRIGVPGGNIMLWPILPSLTAVDILSAPQLARLGIERNSARARLTLRESVGVESTLRPDEPRRLRSEVPFAFSNFVNDLTSDPTEAERNRRNALNLEFYVRD